MQITILKLEGRLDTTRVSEIELSFNAKAGSLKSDEEAAIIDLKDCKYISSMGIRLLVTTIKQFQRRGVRFRTIKPFSPSVFDTLLLASMAHLLNFSDSEQEARDEISN